MAPPPTTPTLRRASSSHSSNTTFRATLAIADTASWYCSIIIVALILFTTLRDTYPYEYDHDDTSMYGVIHQQGYEDHHLSDDMYNGDNFLERRGPCDEIYVVAEGETLHTISDKCGDPFIVERNPHIHDPDDVFPGLVIRIVPSSLSNKE